MDTCGRYGTENFCVRGVSMKHKSGIFRLVRRWPAVLALVLAFCLLLCQAIYISRGRQRQSEQNLACAQLVVEQASQQFRQAMVSVFDRMSIATGVLNRGEADTAELLSSLKKSTAILDAAVVRDGEMLRLQDGALQSETEPKTAKRYAASAGTSFVLQEDGTVQLRSIFMDGELVLWPDMDALGARLCSAIDGGCDFVVYNSVTGDYLLNRSEISKNYYEFLMALDTPDGVDSLFRIKNAVAALNLDGSGTLSYIAQHQSGINPWCLALFIPETALPSAQGSDMVMQTLAVAIISVLLFAIACCALAVLLKLRRNQISACKSLTALESMVEQAATQSRTALFIYQRDTEKVPFIKDGTGTLDQSQACVGMDELMNGFSLSQEDRERLMDAIHALAPGEETVVTVNSSDRGAEEHALSFSLKRQRENGNLVTATVRDCTQERFNRERALEEVHFSNSMRQKSNMIWQYNVSRGNWRLVFARGVDPARMGVSASEWRRCDTDIGLMRTMLHPDDCAAFIARMRPDAVAEMYHCGRDEMELEYRLRMPGDKTYSWYRQIVRTFRAPETNDIMADAYAINVDAEKRAEMERNERRQVLQQTLTALGGIFYGLYYVDLDTDTSYTVKSLGGDLVTQLHASFEKTFAGFIDQRVHPDDRAQLHDILNCYRLKRMVTEENHFIRTDYRRKSGDQYRKSILIIQAARFENGVIRDIVIALRKNDDENEQK